MSHEISICRRGMRKTHPAARSSEARLGIKIRRHLQIYVSQDRCEVRSGNQEGFATLLEKKQAEDSL